PFYWFWFGLLLTIEEDSAFFNFQHTSLGRALLEHKQDNLERSVRLLTTKVWPSLYSLLTIQYGILHKKDNYSEIWKKPKDEVHLLLSNNKELYTLISTFRNLLTKYYSNNAQDIDTALEIIDTGLLFLSIVQNLSNKLFEIR
ncbi:hypothetical protein EDD68_1271, partial [Melghiribacillus thermohalophilus]